MLGICLIFEENGFYYNFGYFNEMVYNVGGGYNYDKYLVYIDQVLLIFIQDLECWIGILDVWFEGNIVNCNYDDNFIMKWLQDLWVSFNDLLQESWGGGLIICFGWFIFVCSFDDCCLIWCIGMMNKV